MIAFDAIYDLKIFKDVDKTYARNLFKKANTFQLKPGEYLFHSGLLGRGMYFILSGSVDVILEVPDMDAENKLKEFVISSLKPYSYFGEICFLEEGLRTASAKATEKTQVLYLDNEVLMVDINLKNIQAYQLALNIAKILAEHVRTLNEIVIQLKQQHESDLRQLQEQKP